MAAVLKDELKSVEDYIPYFHTRQYMKRRYRECNLSESALMKSAGYATPDLFLHHQEEWLRCEGSIPAGYLEAIGVDFRVLEFVLDLDRELYDTALSLPLQVASYGVRTEDLVTQIRTFGSFIDYERALQLIRGFSEKQPFQFFINIPGIRYSEVSRMEGEREILYRPSMVITRSSVEFSSQNAAVLMGIT